MDEEYKWAVYQLQEFEYRKTFGMTHAEYINEPLEVYMANLQILKLINDEKVRELKKSYGKNRHFGSSRTTG